MVLIVDYGRDETCPQYRTGLNSGCSMNKQESIARKPEVVQRMRNYEEERCSVRGFGMN